ncbi:MAG: SDR family NAD(P)-dependent oxidoreductase, partial [Janthinobacterium lividum]
MLPLNGLTAFITGAGQGIGRAIAEALALGGAALYLADINGGAVQEVAASLSSGGAHAQSLALDVANRDACFNAASTLTQDGKKIDILVNAAGIYKAAPFLAHTNADFQRLLDINLFGVINLSQAFLPGMQERGFGRIVNIASTAGKSGQP